VFKIHDHEQGSALWFEARLGKITGSIASDIITSTGKKSSASEEVINRAVAELILQKPDESFQSDSMLRGKELEDQALKYFNLVYDYNFKKCGFVEAVSEIGESLGFGASPDGIDLNIRTGLELKCPEAHTHLAYLTGGKLPKKYFQQIQTAMMVTGFEKWVFGSYYPEMPCFRVEVPRDEEFIKAMLPMFVECAELIKQRRLQINQIMAAS
jgi:hypothetical protein